MSVDNNKRELREALLKIAVYVVAMSLYENVGEPRFGAAGRFAAALILLALLLWDMRRKGDGFCETPLRALPYGKLLYLLPMLALMTVNLWNGAVLRFGAAETTCCVGAMLAIGVIEELLFRGYLLRAMERQSAKAAVLVTGLTFGLGHIVNLLNGEELVSTLLQVVYAAAIGWMLSVFMLRTRNIVPCCVFHGVFNALSAFADETKWTGGKEALVTVAITTVSLLYAQYLWKLRPAAEKTS